MNNVLSTEQIAMKAPAVVELTHADNLSKHYTHIPTMTLVEDMAQLGWEVVDVKQGKSRDSSKRMFKKHMVVFRNPNIKISREGMDAVFPQILLTNSHDGKSSFQFRAGLFRLICSNGLVISTQDFAQARLRHSGYSFDHLKGVVMEMVNKIPDTIKTPNSLTEVELTEEQKMEFALKAIGIRFDKGNAEVLPQELLVPLREQDKGNDLWSVFNVVQEKLVRGGFKYTLKEGRRANRTARRISNFIQDIRINEQLFDLAKSYANA